MKRIFEFPKAFFLISIFYLCTRLYQLLILPIFTDEAIYIYWAKYIVETKSHWFISLTDGKPPLLVWLMSAFLSILPSHLYLLAGRLPVVIIGLFGMWGIYKLTKLLFRSTPIAYLACIFWIISPFILLYDRMALFDGPLSSVLVWAVYFSIKTSQTRKYKDALLWGIFLGLGFLFKPTAIIFVALTPLVYLIYSYTSRKSKSIVPHIIYIGIPLLTSEIMNNIQRLSKVYYLMDAKNQQFQQPWEKILRNPFELTYGNLHGFFSWIISYYSLPVFILGTVGLIYLFVKHKRDAVTLLILWFTPIFFLATFGREIFPRYILFTTPYFIIVISYLLYEVLRIFVNFRVVILFLIITILFPSIKTSYFLLQDPPKAVIPPTDYHQYISEQPSGYGLAEIFSYLNKEKSIGPITIVTQGTFGLYHYGFLLEYWNDKNVTIVPRWPLSVLDQEIFDRAKKEKVFIVLKEHNTIPEQLPLQLLLQASKPGGKYPILLTTLK